ncbi:hypothetical protein C0J52_16813 [Blattella germanica]|nr:hypothetical protein C0J52_16813 [Blattella germanica]
MCRYVMGGIIPSKSKKRYEIEYKNLCSWRMVNEEEKVSEDIVLAYMLDLSKKFVSSSLWSKYSMIKAMLLFHDDTDIPVSSFPKVISFLKKN